MPRMSTLNSPYLLGFDGIERLIDRVSRSSGDGYPPYNIERLPRNGEQATTLRITLAVAGFTKDQLDVTLEDNQLTIKGKQTEEPDREYLHRGIAARQFQRTFVLADGMEVGGAGLENGLLVIDLVRPEPERVVRTIEITDIA
ncbi:Hsp20 family protein [Microbaculum marinisediminis]|uniref:Hsp20 family protein n=1 Tax=Microbaculum marinisediminis TaxID=2931392 RepID=A0AAW5R2B1_9HYPH|nr:Hsp20 family protein [Microbaculum sp. A6E488]MCT8973272.1 Hsp20 family protein [Microbaculum sp. A6E488]